MEKLDWFDALRRIKAAAKAYTESGQKFIYELASILLIKFQAKPKSTGRINEAHIEFKKDCVKDSTWRSKYDPVLTNVINVMKKE